MPVTHNRKPKASPSVETKSLIGQAMAYETTPLVSGLDLSNKASRTPIAWLMDASPSMEGFTQMQLDRAVKLVNELCKQPITSRAVMFDIVQIGTPPASTGFQEISRFQVPALHETKSTPLHTALEQLTNDLGGLCSDLRSNALERTDSVVIVTTDGFANDTTKEILEQSIDAFVKVTKTWSVTSFVIGVGNKLNEDVLKRLANDNPPYQIDNLNAAALTPFIEKIAQKVSGSKKGQKVGIDLPDEFVPIE